VGEGDRNWPFSLIEEIDEGKTVGYIKAMGFDLHPVGALFNIILLRRAI